MIYLLITLSFIVGILRGVKEGMVMIQPQDWNCKSTFFVPGVRTHEWFRWYHLIDIIKIIAFTILLILTWEIRPSVFFITGQLIAIWEGFELAYWYSRDLRIIGKTELITFLDIIEYRLNGWQVKIAHLTRMTFAILLFKQGI